MKWIFSILTLTASALALTPNPTRAADVHEISVPVACKDEAPAQKFNEYREEDGLLADPTQTNFFEEVLTNALLYRINNEAGSRVCKPLHGKVAVVSMTAPKTSSHGTETLSVYKVRVQAVYHENSKRWVPKVLILYVPVRWVGSVI